MWVFIDKRLCQFTGVHANDASGACLDHADAADGQIQQKLCFNRLLVLFASMLPIELRIFAEVSTWLR